MKTEIINGVNVLIQVTNEDVVNGVFSIPSNITVIGKSAFKHCDSLVSVIIPSSVTTIGDDAFSFCISLTSVIIPSSVTIIPRCAFFHCSSLTSVIIPSSVKTIGRRAFIYCSSLTSIIVPSSVTIIEDDVFAFCSSLTSIIIPTSVTSIGASAFSFCSSLTSIIIPTSVTTIRPNAFFKCSSLTSVIIPSSVRIIHHITFSDCSSLASVIIPSNIVFIAEDAFHNCKSLTRILVASDSAKEIERIRGLVPNWDEDIVSYYAVAQQEEFIRRFYFSARLLSKRDVPERLGSVLPLIAQHLNFQPVERFRKELDALPYTSKEAYIAQIQNVYNCHLRPLAAERLQKYMSILERVHPNSFFHSTETSGEQQAHRELRLTLHKIVDAWQRGAAADLSDDEKSRINKPYLLSLIPRDIQGELVAHTPSISFSISSSPSAQ